MSGSLDSLNLLIGLAVGPHVPFIDGADQCIRYRMSIVQVRGSRQIADARRRYFSSMPITLFDRGGIYYVDPEIDLIGPPIRFRDGWDRHAKSTSQLKARGGVGQYGA
jgi:hypothetical protein